MFRPAITRSLLRIRTQKSYSTTPPGGGGGGKGAIIATGATLGTLGGVVGYAGVDKHFRKTVEEAVPGASGVFGMILGEEEVKPEVKPEVKKKPGNLPSTVSPPSKKRPIVVPPVEEKKVEEVKEVKIEPKPLPSAPAVPLPPLEEPSMTSDKKEEVKVKEISAPEPVKTEEKPKEVPKKIEEVVPKLDITDEVVLSDKDLHRRVTKLKEELEAQMVSQLKRQTEAHSDHIKDELDVQKKELKRHHDRELDEVIEKAALAYKEELSVLVGHLRGLDQALAKRSHMDLQASEAQELWLACSACLSAVSDSCSPCEVRSLLHELTAVKTALDKHQPSDQFASAIVKSIPEVVSTRGVFTEAAIRERFLKVEKMARRTALIGDEGGSLFKYLLSYVQSMFIMSPSTSESIPDADKPMDLESLTTFDVVWLARASLDRGDLDQAVRYMTLLKGEPRKISKDWLTEARLLLETRQACLALMAHAASLGVEALPSSVNKKDM